NSELYKYYSVIDNKTATAYYLYNFSVENDSYGTQTIVATQIDHVGLLPEDPEITDNYPGKHSLLVKMSGDYLRSPQEITNISYNHSKVYQIKDVFYDVSPGAHHVDLKFFTYFGNYTAGSDINVRIATTLTVQAQQIGNDRIMVFCSLMGNKTPLAGQPIELVIGDDEITVMTDGLGQCTNIFETNESVGSVTAKYPGSETYLPSVSTYPFATAKGFDLGGDLIINNFGLLFFVSLLFAFSVMNLIHGFGYMFGGSVLADALKKFLPFPPGGISKGMKLTGKTKEKESAGSLTGTMTGSDDKKNKEKEAAKKAAESEMKKRIAEQQKADERKKPEKKDNKWEDYENRRKKAMLETEEKKALAVVVKKGEQEPEKIAVATSEKTKKAEEESRGKELAKRGIEEGDKDAVIAGLVRRREEDRYIKVFDTEMRQMRETEHQRQKYATKEVHLQPDVNAGRITRDEMELIANTHEFDRSTFIVAVDYRDKHEEEKIISSLQSRLEERKTDQWLRAHGFKTKTEILPNPESEKTVDIVGKAKQDVVLRYKGIDDNGNETYKEDKIAKDEIVAIECKSYEEKDFYYMLKKKDDEGGWGQLRNSVSSKDVNQTYLSVTNDFNQLPYKERYEFAEKINGANAKLIIADHSAKDNKDEVGKIIEKLKKEKGD
ncbi:hypothetical protein KKG55_04910, partial [Candidatus Micrarchaeota archaeon]|nr:hypothetical protein [Candidatus Micrarchaeota archaeon]